MSKKFDSERIFQFSASKIHIISEDAVQWTLDGEDGGICAEVVMTNHQYALPIICDHSVSKGISHKYAKQREDSSLEENEK